MTSRENNFASFPFAHPQDESTKKEAVSSSTSTKSEEAKHLLSPDAEAAYLRVLKDELSNMPHDEKSALVHVQRVASNLVDDNHLLRFLRREDYDAHLAVKRLARYWFQRYKLFGPDKYALPMTLNGAMKDDIETLQQGYITLFPKCDESGRVIIYLNKSVTYKSNPTTDEKIRVLWYILHLAMQNPVALENGYVILVNARGGRLGGHDPRLASQVATCCDCAFPIPWKMVHVCHSNAVFPLVAQSVKAILSKTQRQSSLLLHNGSDERVLESLSKYGLPKQCVPTHLGGTFYMSTDVFVQDRLTIEGGGLKMNEATAKSLPPSHDGNSVSNPRTTDQVLGDSIYDSSDTEKPRAEDSARKGASLTATCLNHPELVNSQIDAVIAENNFISSVQEAIPANEQDFIGVKYASAKSNIPNNNTNVPHSGGKLQEKSQQKRKNVNDHGNKSKQPRATPKVKKVKVNHGPNGDPRMNRAVQAKVDNPNLSLMGALLAGGFVFNDFNSPGVNISDIKDAENITVYQRRNQLLRRLRNIQRKASKK